MKWIDIHAHLNMLEISPQEACDLALSQGVERIITIGTCSKDHETVFNLSEELSPTVYATIGVHPHDAKEFDKTLESKMMEQLQGERIVAVAEIGLDYYYDYSPREKQVEAFRRQMEMAQELSLPVQIHTRDAEEPTLEILKEFSGSVKGLLHCFTGSYELAMKALDYGFNISFSGIVTFKNADELRRVAKDVPLDRIHVETDSPFLTPVPFRGKKNSPEMVVHTAKVVAEQKQIELEELSRVTNKNALDMFPKIQWEI